jgi:hypothetical protein
MADTGGRRAPSALVVEGSGQSDRALAVRGIGPVRGFIRVRRPR